MNANQKNKLRVGSMLKFENGEILKVIHFIFSEILTYQFGEPVEDSVVHVNIYHPDDLTKPIGRRDFVNLKFVNPVQITKELLGVIGFGPSTWNNRHVLQCGNWVIAEIAAAGISSAINIKTDEVHGVEYVHEAQFLVGQF